VTVGCSGSGCLLERFKKVKLWEKSSKKRAKWSKVVVFLMNSCINDF